MLPAVEVFFVFIFQVIFFHSILLLHLRQSPLFYLFLILIFAGLLWLHFHLVVLLFCFHQRFRGLLLAMFSSGSCISSNHSEAIWASQRLNGSALGEGID
jgi:hypothetical protein